MYINLENNRYELFFFMIKILQIIFFYDKNIIWKVICRTVAGNKIGHLGNDIEFFS